MIKRYYSAIALVALLLAPILAGILLFRSTSGSPTTASAPKATDTAAPLEPIPAASASSSQARSEFRRLAGKWLRPDGGYVLEIRSVDADGKMDVGYFNPRPINVFKAMAAQEGSATKVFIELRDTGYPGCTYNLTYVPGPDRLAGIYYQAAIQQDFPVEFERMKE